MIECEKSYAFTFNIQPYVLTRFLKISCILKKIAFVFKMVKVIKLY